MNDNVTKLNLGFERSKLIRTKLNEEVTKIGRKTYIITRTMLCHKEALIFFFTRTPHLLRICHHGMRSGFKDGENIKVKFRKMPELKILTVLRIKDCLITKVLSISH